MVAREVRRQMSELVHNNVRSQSAFRGTGSITDFSWANEMATMSKALPTLYAALRASMPKKLLNDNNEPTYV